MKSENFNQDAADDGLYVDSNTTVDDIKSFLKQRAESPVVIDDTIIWDFCGYERDRDALEQAVRYKLQNDKFIIPFQVHGIWGTMYSLLPERLQNAEILVYDPKQGVYKGYTNFSKEMSTEEQQMFSQDLARRVSDLDV